MSDRFLVSVKGVLEFEGAYLLRKNERNEWELLGGKLEKGERPEQRLVQEFVEESGIGVEVVRHLEPWLYEIGSRNIIIVPYTCAAVWMPERLVDEDEGILAWHRSEGLAMLRMPEGYLRSIRGEVPCRSYSPVAEQRPPDSGVGYEVHVQVEGAGEEVGSRELDWHASPREVAEGIAREACVSVAKLSAEPCRLCGDCLTVVYEVGGG